MQDNPQSTWDKIKEQLTSDPSSPNTPERDGFMETLDSSKDADYSADDLTAEDEAALSEEFARENSEGLADAGEYTDEDRA